ncbi:hypothetical protein KCV07_g60, partial [Aureobasidium melanogenum]
MLRPFCIPTRISEETQTTSVAVAIGTCITIGWTSVHSVTSAIASAVASRIASTDTSVWRTEGIDHADVLLLALSTLRRSKVAVAAFAVFADQLRLTGLNSFLHCLAELEMTLLLFLASSSELSAIMDGARWRARIILSDPAFGDFAACVFHRAAVVRWNTIASLVRSRVVLAVGRGCVGEEKKRKSGRVEESRRTEEACYRIAVSLFITCAPAVQVMTHDMVLAPLWGKLQPPRLPYGQTAQATTREARPPEPIYSRCKPSFFSRTIHLFHSIATMSLKRKAADIAAAEAKKPKANSSITSFFGPPKSNPSSSSANPSKGPTDPVPALKLYSNSRLKHYTKAGSPYSRMKSQPSHSLT